MQAHRQPGSAFKPFVYAAALEAGYTQASVIDHLDEPIATLKGAWLPDDGHAGEASLDLRNALRISSNRAAIRLLQQVGIPSVVTLANTLGLEKQPAVPSLALGSGSVTLASLTAAYAAFANGGMLRQPTLIRRVDDDGGHVLFAAKDQPVRVLNDSTAFLVSDMLTDVINAGTASKARARSASGCLRRAKRARRTTSTTRGSSATRRVSSWECGSGSIRHARSAATRLRPRWPCRSGPVSCSRPPKETPRSGSRLRPEWMQWRSARYQESWQPRIARNRAAGTSPTARRPSSTATFIDPASSSAFSA
jgi:hypothetical protein